MENDAHAHFRCEIDQNILIQNIDKLKENDFLVDCTLEAEGNYMKVHKVILAANSEHFKKLFSEQYKEEPIFSFRTISFEELTATVDFMYRGHVNISQDKLPSFLKAAEALKITGFFETSASNVSSENNNNVHQENIDLKQEGIKLENSSPRADIDDDFCTLEDMQKIKELDSDTIEKILENPEFQNELHSEQIIKPLDSETQSKDCLADEKSNIILFPTTSKSLKSKKSQVSGKKNRKPYSCSVCGKRYKKSGFLMRHCRVECGRENRWECKICKKKMKFKCFLLEHMKKHNLQLSDYAALNIEHPCEHCGKRFKRRSHLVNHLKEECEKRTHFECDICKLKTKSKNYLKMHMQRHSEDAKICPNCGKIYRRTVSFVKHLQFECERKTLGKIK